MTEPTPQQIRAAMDASYKLRDSGDSARGIKPTSTTANLRAHAEVMLRAALNTPEAPK